MLLIDSYTNFLSNYGSVTAKHFLEEMYSQQRQAPDLFLFSASIGHTVCRNVFMPYTQMIPPGYQGKRFLVKTASSPEGFLVYGKITNGFIWSLPSKSLGEIIRVRPKVTSLTPGQRLSQEDLEVYRDPILDVTAHDPDPLSNLLHLGLDPKGNTVYIPVGLIINGAPTKVG